MPRIQPPPIRVLIIGSRTLIRSGLSALLRGQPQIQVVGESPAWSEAAQADVLLWDVGDTDPRALSTPFLVLLSNAAAARAWLDAGACGILMETSPLEETLDAIRQVARGETFVPPQLAQTILAALSPSHASNEPPLDPLTEREREVLQLLAQGLSNKDIAQKLYLSVRTVEGHLANIYGKLQVKSRMEAALWAIGNR